MLLLENGFCMFGLCLTSYQSGLLPERLEKASAGRSNSRFLMETCGSSISVICACNKESKTYGLDTRTLCISIYHDTTLKKPVSDVRYAFTKYIWNSSPSMSERVNGSIEPTLTQ
eukprot:GHVH01007119.1.p3 GENE.GHVH01007119.1~~GHVH01007119.1.p3  ORF type:complete len:115 (+),score=6.08 GHVH01007119.1:614-958(+)